MPADLPPMHQDQARVQQILNNLLSNAIKFTPEGGRITVNIARDDEDCLVMQVSDTGVGIAEEDQQTIFEKFRQGRTGAPSGDAMTREYSGTGPGTVDRQGIVQAAGRRGFGAQRVGQRQHLHRPPALDARRSSRGWIPP